MKAAYIEKFGGPEVLIVGNLPDPVAGPGQIVVETVAASINAAQISGAYFPTDLSASEIELSLLHGTRMRYHPKR